MKSCAIDFNTREIDDDDDDNNNNNNNNNGF